MPAAVSLSPQEWQQLENAFDAVADLPDAQREQRLTAQLHDRPDLLQHALGWSRSLGQADDFLEPPAQAADKPYTLTRNEQIDDWQILEPLAHGGTSEVYLVSRNSEDFQQHGALKLLRNGSLGKQFKRERQLLNRLSHPNIAHFLDGGTTASGHAYTVVEYVPGLSLSEACHQQDLSLAQRLQLFLKICDAVRHAHAQLIVHRDLKPGNVRISVDGEPKLLDFGIGRLLDNPDDLETTQVLFTPSYAAPEQIEQSPVSVATDIYGLGGVLHFMLCHRAPWGLDKASLPVAIERILDDEPPNLLSGLAGEDAPFSRRLLQGDLNHIVQKAMARDPAQRYPSVDALAADIKAFLEYRPIQASGHTPGQRAWRFLRRNPWQSATGFTLLSALVAGLALSQFQTQQIAAERDAALRSAERAHAVRSSLFQLLHASQSDDQALTGSDLFESSISDIRKVYADDPDTAAQMLAGFGQLYFINNDYTRAEPLLREALALADDSAVGSWPMPEARIDLAQTLFRTGNYAEAASFLEQALSVMQQDPMRWRHDLIDSASLKAQLLRNEGNTEQAIAVLRTALDQQLEWAGENSTVTAILATNLATNYLYAGQLEQAQQAFRQAWDYWTQTQQTESPDALNLLNNWGLAALRDGDLNTAQTRLNQAHELRTKLFGPSAALAALKKNLGEAYWHLGDHAAALQLMSEAESMTVEFVGAASPLHIGISSYLADLYLEIGRADDASQVLQRCCRDMTAPYSLLQVRAHAVALSTDALVQRQPASDDAFARTLAMITDNGQTADLVRAFVQEKWAQAQLGDTTALEHLAASVALRRQAQGPDHWQTLAAQLKWAQALALHNQRTQARELANAAVLAARRRYGENSAAVAALESQNPKF